MNVSMGFLRKIDHPFPIGRLWKGNAWSVYCGFTESLEEIHTAAAQHSLVLHISNTLWFVIFSIIVNSFFPPRNLRVIRCSHQFANSCV